MFTTRVAVAEDRAGAAEIWHAANLARGIAPGPTRVARVQEKLAEDSSCLLVARDDARIFAMALAEPYRQSDGNGPAVTDRGHISMVFVDPAHWGQGLGGQLLDALHEEMRARGWTVGSLWTRTSNARARRLYEARGYRITEDIKHLPGGDEIVRYEARLNQTADDFAGHHDGGSGDKH